MKVLTVVGARPQFVKAFPVSRALRRDHEEVLVHTGQHYDDELSAVFFDELDIPEPDHHLGVGSGSHAVQTGEMLLRLDDVIDRESPDALLLYGDTNSTLAGAVAGSKRDVTLVHVEAGLRSYNRSMPEEINRVVTDHVADVLFAPTDAAAVNLLDEGVTADVHVTGDVMYDAILWARGRAAEHSTVVADLGLTDGEYVLATVHRAGNTDDPDRLEAIVAAFERLDREVVLPAHPRTVERLDEFDLASRAHDAVRLVDPVGYLDFVRLLDGAERVATDSGGVQKEAFFLDTPCVTLRDETEWTETVDAGWNELAGADTDAIVAGLTREWTPTGKPEPYGDGTAAETIAGLLDDA
ncbi:non-hydrolyzing UDP-N-acetylglucosamine 2-epimerase [Halobacteriaceae archaeon GCM10025711]